MSESKIKICGKDYDIWATSNEVAALNNQGNAALGTELESGKALIAQAINDKGGTASADESMAELAQDVRDINESFITYGVEVTEKIDWLKFICSPLAVDRLPLTGISSTEITEIREYAFANCTALENLDLPNLTTINGYAFRGCSSLKTLDLPNLDFIYNYAFSNCISLQTLYLPNLNLMNNFSFTDCSSLQTVNLPNLNAIGISVFQNCSSLKIANFPNLSSSGSGTFSGCTALTHLTLGRLISSNEILSSSKENLRNITIGQDTNVNLDFHFWTARFVIGGQGEVDELNSNLQTNLISKLYQNGNKILRLGAALYDITTQETRDMVTAKGWTLQRG